MGVAKKMKEYWGTKQDTPFGFVPYKDSEGNILGPEDILFIGGDEKRGRQRVDIWGTEEETEGLNIYSRGVTWLPEETEKFPIGLKKEDGTVLYQKISAKTGEKLPVDAGRKKVIRVRMIGAPNSGKSIYRLQITDPVFHNMLAKGVDNFAITDGLPAHAPLRRKYEEARADFKKGILPEPTKKNEYIIPYHFNVQCGKGEEKKMAILRVEDTSGEECMNSDYNTRIYADDYLILMVAGDDILAGEQGETVQYTKVLEEMIPKLRLLYGDTKAEIIVVVTKCDLLDCHAAQLKDAAKNSLKNHNGKLTQIAHENGFNYEVFNKRSRCVKQYMQDTCPNFYNSLTSLIPEENLTFCMMASVGEECHQNRYENYNPFCIDEPILLILTKAGLYPVAVEDYSHDRRENEGMFPKGLPLGMKKIFSDMKDILTYEDDDEDLEG